mgnify:CR=1 FL=1
MTKPLAGKHILIVEDEPVFRSLLDSWLSSLGANTSLADDGIDALEKMAVEAFKLGYEVTEPEELEVEEGDTVICCDILSEGALKAELIDAQVEQLMNLAEKFEVEYDGWGTYFEDPNGEDGEEGDDEDYVDEDDDGVRH